MLLQYDPINVERILREETAPPPFPPAADRDAWEEVREHAGPEHYAAIIERAETAAVQDIPFPRCSRFLEFFRNGERSGYEQIWFDRRMMLADLALAECLEFQGRFLDPVLDLAWAICEESSWEFPAHHRDLVDVEHPVVGLFSAQTGTQLAELDLLLGDQLHPILRKRIHHEADQRLITPFLMRHDHWWLHGTPQRPLNNWTGVCSGNMIATALYLEKDPARLAEVIARAARSLADYIPTFDSDGGSTEGPAYWGFGFGNYVLAGHLLHQRTNGRIDFFADPLIHKIARFPLRTILSPGYFVNFSDCDQKIYLSVPLLAYLSQQLNIPELSRLAHLESESVKGINQETLSWKLRSLLWHPRPGQTLPITPARHDWYSDMMWMIARYDPADPNGLVLAAKGGHNDEMHNQNDVGNIIVHVNQVSVIADVGRGRYTRAYFSDKRYQHFVNQSLGHSLPVPNGQQQGVGKEFAARLLEHHADDRIDRMALELKDAYPAEAGLASLKRAVTLHREPPRGWVELVDEVEFSGGNAPFETALTTFGTANIGPDAVTLQEGAGVLKVAYDPAVVTVRAEQIDDVDLSTGPRTVIRVVFALKTPQQRAAIRLAITPA